MTITPMSAVLGLPPMTWRRLTSPPYDIANFRGGHIQAPREYPFIDGSGHEWTGQKDKVFDFTLYFLNELGDDLFPNSFNEWFEAFAIDGEPDSLFHPLLGEVDARPLDWDVELSTKRESGVIFKVKFTDTILDPEEVAEVAVAILNLEEAAVAVDEDMEILKVDWPTGQRVDSALDLARQLASLAFSARLTIEGMVNQAKAILGGVIDDVLALNDHATWALDTNLKSMFVAVEAIGEAAGVDKGGREVGFHLTTFERSIDDFATSKKNTVGEIYTLNFHLVGQPSIPKGTSVKYFAS